MGWIPQAVGIAEVKPIPASRARWLTNGGAQLLPAFVLVFVLGLAPSASAQFENLYPGFFQLQKPSILDAVLFGGGFGSPKYGTIQEGFQLDQSITPYFNLVGRVTGYQLWVGDHFENPLAPGEGHSHQLDFGRLQAGAEFALYPGTRFFLLGGGDVGASHAAVIEGDLSSWLFTHTRHPINFSFSASHDSENHVTNAEIDLQVVALSTANYLFTAGAGGAIYQGGQISQVGGQGGVDLGVYFRNWGFGVAVQSGYGDADGFSQLSFIKQFDFAE
jgi:hypothetical protein